MTQSCAEIKNSLSINYRNGQTQISSCCVSKKITLYNATESLISNYLQNSKLIEIKQDNANGILRPDYCNQCLKPESQNLPSRRQYINQGYKTGFHKESDQLTRLEVNLGNTCNLKCTICSSQNSSEWIADETELGIQVPRHLKPKTSKQFSLKDPDTLKNLESIRFTGGEPLSNDQHLEFLQTLEKFGIIENLAIEYETNGTQKVSDEVLKLWSRARIVQLFFSIDDIEERFEYQRFGAKWDNLLENLEWYKENIDYNHLFHVTTSISLLNLCTIAEFLNWKNSNFDTNRMGDKIHHHFNVVFKDFGGESVLGIDTFTSKQHLKILSQLPNQIKSFVTDAQINDSYDHSITINYLNKLDKIRNTNWRKTFPELVDILEQHI